jgi:hypothetical protein
MQWCKGTLILVMFALLVPMGGCCGGTDTTVVEKQPIRETSLGDELLKLKDAQDKGIITADEFETAKAKLLKSK